MCLYNKKKPKIQNVKFFVLWFLYFLVYIWNSILKKVSLGLKNFHDFF